MRRAALLGLVFVLGLAMAGLWYGQMHHLRAAAAAGLPGWTERVAPESRLGRGRMEWAASGLLPDLTLQWMPMPPTLSGWCWEVRLTGAGIDLKGEMLSPFWPGSAVITITGGQLDLGRLVPLPAEIAGVAIVEGGEVQLAALSGTPRIEGVLRAEVTGAALEEAPLGGGPLLAELAADGAWRLETALTGGVTGATLTVDGQWPDPVGRYSLAVDDAGALPAAVQGMLSGAGERAGDGWIVEGEVQAY